MNKVWRPKPIVKCSMCLGNHSHVYNIIDLGIWWTEKYTAYIKYNFCSICYTILNNLWPNQTMLKDNSKKYEESDMHHDGDYLHNSIKRNKHNIFLTARDNYVKNITYPSIIMQLSNENTSIFHYVPKDIIHYIIDIFKKLQSLTNK